jgi:hypothetical protein
MPYAKAQTTKTIKVTGAAPPIPWWLVGLGVVAIVIIVAAAVAISR